VTPTTTSSPPAWPGSAGIRGPGETILAMTNEPDRLGFWGAFFLYGGGIFFAGSALMGDLKGLVALVAASTVVGSAMGLLAIYWRRKDRAR
jgi:hypothetical protein